MTTPNPLRDRLRYLVVSVLALLCMTFAAATLRALTPLRVRASVVNLVLPGNETNQLSDLHTEFRAEVGVVLQRLREEGHQPRVAATFRDATRQDFLFKASVVLHRWGMGRATQASGGRSCHNRTDEAGNPSSLAIDIVHGPEDQTLEQQARFYKALGRAARAQGLEWGGSWSQRNPVWKRFNLGWDPAHVQSRRCRTVRP